MVILHMQVVLLHGGDRGARLLHVEALLELLFSRSRSVDVIREPFEGLSRDNRHVGLPVNACNNMQVAGAATCRLQVISLGWIISGNVPTSVVAPTLTSIEPMATYDCVKSCNDGVVSDNHAMCIVPTDALRPASVITSKQPLSPDAKGTMHTSAYAWPASFLICIQSVARCNKVRFSRALWSEAWHT